ncbi:transposase [Myxococcaceae bacterium GXIMD 01537]
MRLWRRFCVHYTPVHGSWLNQAEIEVSLVSRQCLGTRRVSSLETLQATTSAWARDANRRRVRIRWAFTVPKARRTFRYSPADFIRVED